MNSKFTVQLMHNVIPDLSIVDQQFFILVIDTRFRPSFLLKIGFNICAHISQFYQYIQILMCS